MSAYTTVDDLKTSYPRFSTASVSSATMYAYIERASNYIDGQIYGAVSLPFTPAAPPLVKNMAEDLAFVFYMRRHLTESGRDTNIDKTLRDIQQVLDGIKNGTVTLVDSNYQNITNIAPGASPWSDVSNYTPTFGLSDIEDVVVDDDRLEAEETSRS